MNAITLQTGADRAFAIFTDLIGEWWPLATHSPAESLSSDLVFEDGNLVESGAGGSSVWGTVTEWDPPARLAFTWSASGGPVTSIGIDFEESDGQTRVVLTHDGWEAYGDRAADVRASYAGKLAWD